MRSRDAAVVIRRFQRQDTGEDVIRPAAAAALVAAEAAAAAVLLVASCR